MKHPSDVRAAKIRQAIKLAWGSLDSHLEWTTHRVYPKKRLTALEKKLIKENGGVIFHRKCIAEYAKLIKLLSELY